MYKRQGLHYHTVSHLYILYAMSDLFYHAGKFMSEGLPFFSGIARQNLVVSAESTDSFSRRDVYKRQALGCTGLTTIGIAKLLEQEVGLPVIDPVLAEGTFAFFESIRK